MNTSKSDDSVDRSSSHIEVVKLDDNEHVRRDSQLENKNSKSIDHNSMYIVSKILNRIQTMKVKEEGESD